MSRDVKQFDVGGRSYSCQQMPARKANRMLLRIAKIIGPAVGAFTGLSKVKDATASKDAQKAVTEAIGNLLMSADVDVVEALMDDLLETVIINGKGSTNCKQAFDEHFIGKPGEPYQIALKVININYSNFFDAVASLLDAAPEAKENG